MNVNVRDLRCLLAVAGHRHFGRAAEACDISQPALSVQIRKLEDLLGVALFERTSKTIAPTAACDQWLGHARAAAAEADALFAMARGLRDPLAGRIHLGIIPTLAPYLPPLVFAPASPGVRRCRRSATSSPRACTRSRVGLATRG